MLSESDAFVHVLRKLCKYSVLSIWYLALVTLVAVLPVYNFIKKTIPFDFQIENDPVKL